MAWVGMAGTTDQIRPARSAAPVGVGPGIPGGDARGDSSFRVDSSLAWVVSALPSASIRGRIRSSQVGIHQAALPERARVAGITLIRTKKASIRTPTANPVAMIVTNTPPEKANPGNSDGHFGSGASVENGSCGSRATQTSRRLKTNAAIAIAPASHAPGTSPAATLGAVASTHPTPILWHLRGANPGYPDHRARSWAGRSTSPTEWGTRSRRTRRKPLSTVKAMAP